MPAAKPQENLRVPVLVATPSAGDIQAAQKGFLTSVFSELTAPLNKFASDGSAGTKVGPADRQS